MWKSFAKEENNINYFYSKKKIISRLKLVPEIWLEMDQNIDEDLKNKTQIWVLI